MIFLFTNIELFDIPELFDIDGIIISQSLDKKSFKLEFLGDDSSYDEILKELAFDRMIQKGLKDSKENKTISNEQMKNRIKQW